LADPQPEAIDTAQITWQERGDLDHVIANIPDRAYTRGSNRPSDLVNMLFVGSREQVSAAFTAAGWTETSAASMRSRIKGIRAVAEVHGDLGAPMSTLLVNDSRPDMSWQKSLNDVAKRHHIRLWKQSDTWDGREVWIGAATRDVSYAFLRPGRMFTHEIEENIDHERDKIAHDLEFTNCTEAVELWDRPGFPRLAMNATGDLMSSDARLAVVRLNDCGSPRLTTSGGHPFERRAERPPAEHDFTVCAPTGSGHGRLRHGDRLAAGRRDPFHLAVRKERSGGSHAVQHGEHRADD